MAPYFVDALRNEYIENAYWRPFANAADGQAANITYSFLTKVPKGTSSGQGDPHDGFRAYTAEEKHTVRIAMNMIEAVANIHFRQSSGDTDLNFGQFDIKPGIAGYAYGPVWDKSAGSLVHGANYGDVWLDSEYILDNPHLVLHEVGHALGLAHPFEGAKILPGKEDNKDNTVMSYTGTWQQHLGIYDVIALQSIYGPAKARMGDDTYIFGKSKLIWDGGGHDTITAAHQVRGVKIDLHDGSWNWMGEKTALFTADKPWHIQVYLGNFTTIEDVVGSAFKDTLTGNEEANRIAGGAGRDRIDGDLGRDVLTGGKGADTFIFGDRNDSGNAGGRDLIRDFSRADHDRIDLATIDADQSTGNNEAFDFIRKQAFSGTAGELRFEHRNGNTLVMGDTDGNGFADFAVALNGKIALSASDFVL